MPLDPENRPPNSLEFNEHVNNMLARLDAIEASAVAMEQRSNERQDKYVAEVKSEMAQRFRINIATELLAANAAWVSSHTRSDDSLRDLCRRALYMADLLLDEASK